MEVVFEVYFYSLIPEPHQGVKEGGQKNSFSIWRFIKKRTESTEDQDLHQDYVELKKDVDGNAEHLEFETLGHLHPSTRPRLTVKLPGKILNFFLSP